MGVKDVQMYTPGHIEALHAKGLYDAHRLKKMYDENTVVHCFSGGYYLYLMSLVRKSCGKLEGLPKALIVDSAPIEPKPYSVHRYMEHGYGIKVNKTLLHHFLSNTWELESKLYSRHARKYKNDVFNHSGEMTLMKDFRQRIQTKVEIPTMCLVATSDKVLDIDYCDSWVKQHQCEYVKYDKGKHARLFASNDCYFSRIDKFLKSIEKKPDVVDYVYERKQQDKIRTLLTGVKHNKFGDYDY